jgi:YVTN family beta-propeller protein
MEDEFVEIRFQVKDAGTGQPVRGLNPAAWMDIGQAIEGKGGEQRDCREKVGLYLKGIVGIRPLVDLNAYYLLVMNQDASLSVIDPVVSMTGVTSLYAQVLLERPAADWARGANGRKLYVSMPRADKVAVVNTETFKLEGTVKAGEAPTRTVVQPDGKYLWVGNDAASGSRSGVTVIDTEKQEPVATIPTGRGHHEIAVSTDDRYAFVTNRDSGTVSVVDVRALKKVKDVVTGPTPISVAFSALSRAAYVADGRSGTVTVIDGGSLETLTRVTAKPGLGPLRFSPDGRWGFVVNPTENAAYVIDAAENKLAHTIPLPGKPYQVSFTRVFAYLRLIDSERVQMVNLGTLGEGKKPTVQSFPAGAIAPKAAGELAIADSISPANIEAAVFVVNPAEGFTYYYMEGMNSPMGTFQAYGKKGTAGLVSTGASRRRRPASTPPRRASRWPETTTWPSSSTTPSCSTASSPWSPRTRRSRRRPCPSASSSWSCRRGFPRAS